MQSSVTISKVCCLPSLSFSRNKRYDDCTNWWNIKLKTQTEHNTHLTTLIQKLTSTIQNIEDSAPTCAPDLHALYAAYTLGTNTISFALRFSSSLKGAVRTEWDALQTAVTAQNLVLEVLQKAVEIKKNLDEGGLIDWILEALLREDEEDESAVGKVLNGLVSEEYRELWAGMVVESWNDSVAGFSYFRLPELK